MLLASGCESLFLVTVQEFTLIGSEESVMECAFSFRLRRSLFLIKVHAFSITNSEGVCEGVCF